MKSVRDNVELGGEKNLQFRTGNKIKMKYEINVSDLEYIKKVVIVSANESTKAQFEYELRNPQFQIQIGCIEQSNGCEVSKDSKKKTICHSYHCHLLPFDNRKFNMQKYITFNS